MDEATKLYQGWAHGTDSHRYTPVRSRAVRKAVLDLGVTKDTMLLDFACGNGSIRRFLPDCNYYGFDISLPNVTSANSAHVIQADYASGLLYPDNAFDVVIMVDVIEHFFTPLKALREAFRITKPGGHLIVTTPNLASLYNRICLLLGYMPVGPEVSEEKNYDTIIPFPGQTGGHIRVMTVDALLGMGKDAGWTVGKVDSYGMAHQRHRMGWLFRAVDAILPHRLACNQLITFRKL